MTMMKTMLGAAAAAMLLTAPALAANFEVDMLNKGADGAMVFEPGLVQVQPGDTVTFTAKDKGHNAESIKGLIPAGAQPFKGKINQDLQVTFDVPGVYAVKCLPHFALGMVALVVVGNDVSNLDTVKDARLPKKAAERFEADIAKIGDTGAAAN